MIVKNKISRIILNSNFSTNAHLHELFSNEKNILYKYNFGIKKYDYFSDSIVELTGFTKDEINEKGFSSLIKKVVKNAN